MPVDIIEMFWGCLSCKGENLGRFKACQRCGAPRTPQSPEWMPGDVSHARAVVDEAQLRVFRAGEDWRCRFCGSAQFRADGACGQCGAAQAGDAASGRSTALLVSPPQAGAAYQVAARGTVRAVAPPAYRVAAAPIVHPPPPPTSFARALPTTYGVTRRPWIDTSALPDDYFRLRRRKRLIIAGAVVFAVALGVFLLFRTHIERATVASVAWERNIAVERYAIWTREGWSVPAGAISQSDLGQRVHHYDHVKVGSHEESYTERVSCGQDCHTVSGSCHTTSRTCTSNGNGSATCSGGDTVCSSDRESCTTRYCDERRTRTIDDYEDQPRYQDWYTWTIWEWGHQRDAHVAGTDLRVRWPTDAELALGRGLKPKEDERLGPRTEKYTVNLTWDDGEKDYAYACPDEDDFKRFEVGSEHQVRVGVAHGVEVLPD